MRESLGEAIVLAGGFGTRLRKVVSDVPKPMAPMDEKGTPFLALCIVITIGVKGLFNKLKYKKIKEN